MAEQSIILITLIIYQIGAQWFITEQPNPLRKIQKVLTP